MALEPKRAADSSPLGWTTPDSGTEAGATATEHFFVVKGRRWRRTDPGIPAVLATQLVGELMSGRRAVKDATDEEARRRARSRVQDAKVALGERGEPWWEPSTQGGRAVRIAATARALLRHRRSGATICPSEIARVIGGDAWRTRSAEVRQVVLGMAARSELEVRQQRRVVDPVPAPRGAIRLAMPQTAHGVNGDSASIGDVTPFERGRGG